MVVTEVEGENPKWHIVDTNAIHIRNFILGESEECSKLNKQYSTIKTTN